MGSSQRRPGEDHAVRYRHRVLGNGVHVVGVPMPTPSVCFALYLSYGSVHEPAHLSGVSHLLEHLFFKGTQCRSGEELAAAAASIGADTNALTWWLGVCCHSRTLRRHWEQSLRLVAEEMTRPSFTAASLESERPVVLQERARLAWNPKYRSIQALMAASYPGHPLGRPTIGTEQTLNALSLDDVTSYYRTILRPDHLTLVVAGDFGWDEVLAVAEEEIGALSARGQAPPEPPTPPTPRPGLLTESTGTFPGVHLAYALRLGSHRGNEYLVAELLATILGDETRTGSRLWRDVQQRGLADEAFSSYTAFGDHGVLYTYVATTPDRAGAAHDAVMAEFAVLGQASDDEVARARRKLLSRIAIDGESSHKRALAVARLFTGSGRLQTLEEIGHELSALTPDDIRSLVARYRPLDACTGIALGPADAVDRLSRR
jgi:predicted Zn-dependent peptidase